MDKPKRTEEEIEWSNQFARRFYYLLTKKKLDRYSFFETSGYSPREFDRILAGSNPSFHKICKIAKALDAPVHVLMDFSNERKDRFRYPALGEGPSKTNEVVPYIPPKRTRAMRPILNKKNTKPSS